MYSPSLSVPFLFFNFFFFFFFPPFRPGKYFASYICVTLDVWVEYCANLYVKCVLFIRFWIWIYYNKIPIIQNLMLIGYPAFKLSHARWQCGKHAEANRRSFVVFRLERNWNNGANLELLRTIIKLNCSYIILVDSSVGWQPELYVDPMHFNCPILISCWNVFWTGNKPNM